MPAIGDAAGTGFSMSRVAAGDAILVRAIYFGRLGSDCASIGLHAGDVVRCRSSSSTQLNLERRSGGRVLLSQDWARWIEVEHAPQ
jgi:hypothetical protein